MKWFTGLLIAMLAVVLASPDVEAGRKSKCRSVSRCQTGNCSTSVKSSYSFDSNCSGSACEVTQITPVVTSSCSSCPASNVSCSSCPAGVAYSPSGGGRTTIRSSYKFTGYADNQPDLQAWAIEEANRMADLGTNGHVRSAPVGTFVGVGCNGMTCSRPGPPIAEAHVRGKSVRVWRN